MPDRFVPKFYDQADQRQSMIREIKRRIKRLIDETGADTYAKEKLCERAIHMALLIERMELQQAEGEFIDPVVFSRLVAAEQKIWSQLGIEPIDDDSDDTDDLANYVKSSRK